MKNDNFSNESKSHLALSFQLLHLLKWLVENDEGEVKMIIENAFEQGAYKELKSNPHHDIDADSIEDMHHHVLDFFAMLECYLEEVYHKQTQRTVKQKSLRSTIDHIDTTVFDDDNLIYSVEKATTRMEKHPNNNAKQMLYEELLEQWDPGTESKLN
jgi:hypothetical protein